MKWFRINADVLRDARVQTLPAATWEDDGHVN